MQARKMAGMAIAAILLAAGMARADTHAPWPVDWNNWNDPALWVTVSNPGNAGELSGSHAGGGVYDPDRICGAVSYAFNMGKFEVTAGQYTTFLNAVAKTDTYGLYSTHMADTENWLGCNIQRSGSSGTHTYSVASDWANRPVAYVSWGDAARFANWLTHGQPTGGQNASTTEDGSYYLNGVTDDTGLMAVTRIADANRVQGKKYYFIPTEDEWYKAAYHKNDGVTGNYFLYPTGTDTAPSNSLVDPDPGNNANFYVMGGDYTIGSPYYRTPVGEFENSDSPYGTFDQGGNVSEWNEATSGWAPRGLRGGACNVDDSYLSAWYLDGHSPTYEGFSMGFRVSEVPEPATLSLLALCGLAVMRRRRR